MIKLHMSRKTVFKICAKLLLGCGILCVVTIVLMMIWPGGFADFIFQILALCSFIIILSALKNWSFKTNILVWSTFSIVLVIFVYYARDYHYRHAWDSGVPTRIHSYR